MIYLLDTHSFLWFAGGDSRLSTPARIVIDDCQQAKLLNMASVWEMAIKIGLGRLSVGGPLVDFVRQGLTKANCGLLSIELRHLATVAQMSLAQHRDPFDRLLVAQPSSMN